MNEKEGLKMKKICVVVNSQAIIQSCRYIIDKILTRRKEMKERFINKETGVEVGFLFKHKRTRKEAEELANRIEKGNDCEWLFLHENQLNKCHIIGNMAKHVPEMELDYDTFRSIGLAKENL